MLEINVKEARSQFSTLLDKVEQGEEIVITRRGKKVARLVPPERNDISLPSLKRFRASIQLTGNSLGQTVSDLRNEERY